MRYPNSRGKMASTIAHAQILDSVYVYTYRDESVVEVLRGLCGTGILIDPTDGPWSDDLMASDNKWRPMIDAVLYTRASGLGCGACARIQR